MAENSTLVIIRVSLLLAYNLRLYKNTRSLECSSKRGGALLSTKALRITENLTVSDHVISYGRLLCPARATEFYFFIFLKFKALGSRVLPHSHHSLGFINCQDDATKQEFIPIIYPGGEGNGSPLQDSCLENPMDGEPW